MAVRKMLLLISVPLAVIMSLFHIYTGFFGVVNVFLQRGLHLLIAMMLTFMCFPMFGKKGDKKWSLIVDIILLISSIIVFGYVVINYEMVSLRTGGLADPVSSLQIILGIAAILLIIEAVRRVIGWPLAILTIVVVLYMRFGYLAPGIFMHKGWTLKHIISISYLGLEGIYGIPLGVSATFAVLFIILGSFLKEIKLGDFLMDASSLITGRAQGGPAKIAVISSAFFGMISGASVANVYTTGSFTIPMMKKLNYKAHFAAATEAVASTGGALMPPIMGAVAFIMSDITGIPYLEIIKAAAIPAILFYVGLLSMVHFEAVKTGLRGISQEEMPEKSKIYKNLHLILPPVFLVYIMIQGYTPFRAAAATIVFSIIVGAFKAETRINFRGLIRALENGAKNSLILAVATAAAGIILGGINLTGIALRFTSMILRLSEGSLIVPLLMTMFVCLILGMGLPSVPAYLIVTALVATTLRKLGLSLLQAHFFALYFSLISAVTPPVAVSAFAAASIAECDVNKTGFTAFKLAITGFIIPFIFAFDPALLLVGNFWYILLSSITAIIGVVALGAAVQGWFITRTGIIERIALFVGSIILIFPGLPSDIGGIFIIGSIIFSQVIKLRRKKFSM